MITSRTRTAAVALLATPLLAGCSSNFHAQTDKIYTPARGVSDRSGEVYVLNVVVVSGENGNGTVIASLVNRNQENPDTLVDVAVDGTTAQFTPAAQNTTIEPGDLVNLADDAGITATGAGVIAGHFINVTFSFDHAAQITVNAPVVPNTGVYADIPTVSASDALDEEDTESTKSTSGSKSTGKGGQDKSEDDEESADHEEASE